MPQGLGVFEGLGWQEAIIIFLILIVLAFQISMLFDVLVRKKAGVAAKIVWTLIIVFLPLVGALAYYFLGFSKRVKTV